MADDLDPNRLKAAVRSALLEVLEEDEGKIRELLASIVEDVALAHAMREGLSTPIVAREDVFKELEPES